jgi:two-component system, cell cycle sensor histidine kinase and response regulator CckA
MHESESGGLTVLLAEDEGAVLESLAEYLRTKGYRVLEAKNGMEALEVVSEQKFGIGVLITDVLMPKMSGQELAQEIRKRWPRAAIIFISGWQQLDTSYANVPNAALLLKPFALGDLSANIRQNNCQSAATSRIR